MVRDQGEASGHPIHESRDSAVIGSLWQIVDERLGSYIDRRTPRQFDPYDVRIETVLHALLNPGVLPPMPGRVAYLARIATNVIHDMSRERACNEDRRQRPPAAKEEPNDRLAEAELVAKCLELLTGPQRQLFVWRYVERLTYSEIARRKGRSLVALWQGVTRMHRRLRKHLGARFALTMIGILRDEISGRAF